MSVSTSLTHSVPMTYEDVPREVYIGFAQRWQPEARSIQARVTQTWQAFADQTLKAEEVQRKLDETAEEACKLTDRMFSEITKEDSSHPLAAVALYTLFSELENCSRQVQGNCRPLKVLATVLEDDDLKLSTICRLTQSCIRHLNSGLLEEKKTKDRVDWSAEPPQQNKWKFNAYLPAKDRQVDAAPEDEYVKVSAGGGRNFYYDCFLLDPPHRGFPLSHCSTGEKGYGMWMTRHDQPEGKLDRDEDYATRTPVLHFDRAAIFNSSAPESLLIKQQNAAEACFDLSNRKSLKEPVITPLNYSSLVGRGPAQSGQFSKIFPRYRDEILSKTVAELDLDEKSAQEVITSYQKVTQRVD